MTMVTASGDAWSNIIAWTAMAWTFLSVFRFITQPSFYPARRRKGLSIWVITDYLPWAAMRGYLRLVGKAPPTWLPWGLAYAGVLLLLYGCDRVAATALGSYG